VCPHTAAATRSYVTFDNRAEGCPCRCNAVFVGNKPPLGPARLAYSRTCFGRVGADNLIRFATVFIGRSRGAQQHIDEYRRSLLLPPATWKASANCIFPVWRLFYLLLSSFFRPPVSIQLMLSILCYLYLGPTYEPVACLADLAYRAISIGSYHGGGSPAPYLSSLNNSSSWGSG